MCSRGQNKGFCLVPEKKASKETRQKHCCLIVFVCLDVISVLMSTQNRKQNRKLVASATVVFVLRWVTMWWQVIDPSSDFWSHCPQDRWIPEVVMRTTSDQTPRWRSDETWMIKNVSLEFSYDMIFWWILSRSFKIFQSGWLSDDSKVIQFCSQVDSFPQCTLRCHEPRETLAVLAPATWWTSEVQTQQWLRRAMPRPKSSMNGSGVWRSCGCGRWMENGNARKALEAAIWRCPGSW